MQILTKRNGVALVAVLAVLLVLTLLLPLMFTYSERAMEKAMTGTDEQKASYLARTMVEMAVGTFQEFYDDSEDDLENNGSSVTTDADGNVTIDTNRVNGKMEYFIRKGKKLTFNKLYMYNNPNVKLEDFDSSSVLRSNYESDVDYRKAVQALYADYAKDGIIYSTTLPTGYTYEQAKANEIPANTVATVMGSDGNEVQGEYIGYAECTAFYDDTVDYYKTTINANNETETTAATKDEYDVYVADLKSKIASGTATQSDTSYFKVTNKDIDFTATAKINGKAYIRRCKIVLPTKPSDENWIIPANIESNQIFPDTSLASSISVLEMNDSFFVDDAAIKTQPIYTFSCVGNMVVSTKNIKYKQTSTDPYATSILANGKTMDYNLYVNKYNEGVDAINASNAALNAENKTKNEENGNNDLKTDHKTDYTILTNKSSDFSLGLHPETTTIKPEKDPAFNCLKTNNMRSWSKSAQKDNIVAFTATNAIQFDMPVNILMNPCRTGRIGDGIDSNQSLYKILYLQAPTIVFNEKVNSFVSLYTKTSALALILDYNAYRMSSIILAAPENTPYSYHHSVENRTVKAGKVYFAEDAYIWLVPFAENGSNYRTQSVYYKGKDIILYKFANAGDIFLYNAEVETSIQGQTKKAGFSMTAYFMDVMYEKDTTDTSTTKWWQLWSGIQSMIFDSAVSGLREKTYVEQDLKWIGNMNTGALGSPSVDDFYVVWES